MNEFWMVVERILFVLVGAAIGYIGNFRMWRLNVVEQSRQRKLESYRKIVTLAYTAGNFFRNLLYAKKEGLSAVAKLGTNPVDELLAYAYLNARFISPEAQLLHITQNVMFAQPMDDPGASRELFKNVKIAEDAIGKMVRKILSKANDEGLEISQADAETLEKCKKLSETFEEFKKEYWSDG